MDDPDKLLLRTKRFKASDNQDDIVNENDDAACDSFEAVKEKYLKLKKRQERWGTTSEDAKKGCDLSLWLSRVIG